MYKVRALLDWKFSVMFDHDNAIDNKALPSKFHKTPPLLWISKYSNLGIMGGDLEGTFVTLELVRLTFKYTYGMDFAGH